MIIREPELFGHGIVLLGAFNPLTFQPGWFAAHGLIRESEVKSLKNQFISQQLALFELEWLHFQVTPDRFTVITQHEAAFEVIRDLVVGTFRLLEYTPLKMLGINYDIHFSYDSSIGWKDIQRKLTNQELVGNIFNTPLLQTIAFTDIRNYNRYTGMYSLKIEQSVRLPHGIYFGTNDHYEVSDKESNASNGIISILESEWQNSSKQSREYWNKIIEAL